MYLQAAVHETSTFLLEAIVGDVNNAHTRVNRMFLSEHSRQGHHQHNSSYELGNAEIGPQSFDSLKNELPPRRPEATVDYIHLRGEQGLV